ncbi:MAG: beta-N-acetylglucosaminidase domain-containing protein [Sphingomonas sp.]|nr:beta-N-acetylglucosaminidase domain-containing protein [Sphingomonas sp.]
MLPRVHQAAWRASRSLLGRRPLLWDNYPVNDGHRQCRYLDLRGFTGRHAAIAGVIAGHAVNPALQPVLTRIPLLALVDSYADGDSYRYGTAFAKAVRAVAGDHLGAMIEADLLRFQDTGLDRLGDVSDARARYSMIDHPAAREIVAWLDGEYAVGLDLVKTQ